jgi:bifunctional non-homologous end joining protein LigD
MVKVSSADRVVYPEDGFTKGDVVAYYLRIGPRMLPHVLRRPITMKRYPKGLAGKGFMQKNVAKHYPPELIGRIELPKLEGGTTVHPEVHDAAGIAYLANQGMLELHVPTSRAPQLYYPDRLVFDLDPPEGDTTALVRRAAVTARQLFDELSAPSLPMTTGSKGYHVVVSIQPTIPADEAARAMHRFAALLCAAHPELWTLAFRKEKREGKVFADWMRNHVPSTAIAPWSLRGRRGASIAVPLTWDELDDIAPDHFTLRNIDAREGDPLAEQDRHPLDAAELVKEIDRRFEASGIVLEPFDRFRS